jgi:UDP-glucose 4-epimerase
MKKVMITGVAGFIGSNLAERLLKEGYTVIGIDNDKSKIKNIKDFLDNESFIMYWTDINKLPKRKKNKDFEDIDEIFHLAASADILKSSTDHYCDLYNNVQGTHAILEFMLKYNIRNLIFASSSAVYGESPTPMEEDMKDMRPISLYGASKLAAEAYIHTYVDLYKINASIFRFANVVGKNEHRGVIPDFFRKLQEDPTHLEILGNGKQTKSYFLIDDCLDALIKLRPTSPASIYNLGATDTITVTKLADMVVNTIGLKNVKYSYTGGDRGWEGDVPITILSIEKARKARWIPKNSCKDSIQKTVRWLLDNK